MRSVSSRLLVAGRVHQAVDLGGLGQLNQRKPSLIVRALINELGIVLQESSMISPLTGL